MKKLLFVFLLCLMSACTSKSEVLGLEGSVYVDPSNKSNCVFTFKANNKVDVSGCFEQTFTYLTEGDKVHIFNTTYTLKSNGDLVSKDDLMVRK